jgi:tripartite ATP-independent transporter DctP family solute receptor
MHVFRRALQALAVALVLAGATSAEAQQRLRIVSTFDPTHSSTQAMQVFKELVERRTNNQLQIDMFDSMKLGGARENVDATRAGTVFLNWNGMAFLSRIVPEIEAATLPFMFPNREAAFKAMDGALGAMLQQKLGEKGFVGLGFMELGSRHVTNNTRPIRTADDLKGLKIRMQPNETHLATFRALGANPVSLDIKELYSALQQGVVDGQENPYPVIVANRFFEVQKHLTDTGHFFDFIAVVAHKGQFDALSAENQKIIREAAAAAVQQQRTVVAKAEADALAMLKGRMEFQQLAPAEREKMRAATSGVVDQLRRRLGDATIDQVLAIVKAGS